MVRDVKLHDPATELFEAWCLGMILIPAPTGVVHDAGVPRRPRSRPDKRRHEPNELSVVCRTQLRYVDPNEPGGAHDRSARGHCDGQPSISSSTVAAPGQAGVPRSCSLSNVMAVLLGSATVSRSCDRTCLTCNYGTETPRTLSRSHSGTALAPWKSSGKCFRALRTGKGVRPPSHRGRHRPSSRRGLPAARGSLRGRLRRLCGR